MILILDFGSQYTQLIARRIREISVFTEVHPFNMSFKQIQKLNPRGIILSGGPSSVHDDGALGIEREIFEMGLPILGICYGHQLIASVFGAKVEKTDNSEYGFAEVEISQKNALFEGGEFNSAIEVWMSHGDHVSSLPEGFRLVAQSQNSPYCSIFNPEKNIFGIQFHPEVTHTKAGKKILANFAVNICGCEQNWTMENFAARKVNEIRETTGNEKVLCAISGGVDSGVTAALMHKAIGDRLFCVFIDNGLLRKNESRKVNEEFKEHLGINLLTLDCGERFLKALAGITDAEQKRKIIGHEFIAVFEEVAEKHPEITFLAQGTLYPDLIESQSVKGPSATIKSHHNVGGLPEKMNLKIIEPLRELFKDEVRELGLELGLSESIINRQPFPGPGLAVRIPGEISAEKLKTLREVDAVILEEIKSSGLYNKVWQSFGVLLPVKSVGVMGDQRTHEWSVSFRCVDSIDAMTAGWTRLPYDLLAKISSRIVNEVPDVNRVLYDITSKPPGTIEWE